MSLPHGALDAALLARLVAAIPAEVFAAQRWFGAKERHLSRVELADAAALPPAAGERLALLVVADARFGAGGSERYLLPLVLAPGTEPAAAGAGDGSPSIFVRDDGGRAVLREPRDEDGVGCRLVRAIARNATLRGLRGGFACERAPALSGLLPGSALDDPALAERRSPTDQTNTSLIVGERVIYKSYRRLEPGIDPDVEVARFLAERAGFRHVPAFAGTVRYVGVDGMACSAGLLQAFLPGAEERWFTTVADLRRWLGAPRGSVSLDAATAEAERLGTVTGRLHAAFAGEAADPEFVPRRADPSELRAWRRAAEVQLGAALDLLEGEARAAVVALAPRIRSGFAAMETPAVAPILTRVHGDYHLGQVLRAGGELYVIDFGGEPTRPIEERRRRRSPLRDVASMLRSFDHVARQAERETGGGDGLDLEAWLRRSRQRFLAAYGAELRRRRTPIEVDAGLLRAFELEKECYELGYEAAYLPDWLWMPLASLPALVSGG